jgi:peptidyl-prolyl cis-trans isomerase A (cyclophilin A)
VSSTLSLFDPVRFRPLLLLAAAAACGGAPAADKSAAGPRVPAAELLNVDANTLFAAAPDSFIVTFETSAGDFDVLVRSAWAPRGATRLAFLARHDYFGGGRFFRVVPGFVAQFGLSGIPSLDEAWEGRAFEDDPPVASNRRGTLVFANAGPNTRSIQLFLNLVDNPSLDMMGFAPVGEIVRGIEVLDRLYSGYGEGAPYGSGPDQTRIRQVGNGYLAASFPALDSIVRTTIR